MNPSQALERLETLLVQERESIRGLDAKGLADMAHEKLTLFGQLVESDAFKMPELAPRLTTLVGDLRRNGILLAHARDCVRDALQAQGVSVRDDKPSMPPTVTARPGIRLSVDG